MTWEGWFDKCENPVEKYFINLGSFCISSDTTSKRTKLLEIFNDELKSLEALTIQQVVNSRLPVACLLTCLSFCVLWEFFFWKSVCLRPWYHYLFSCVI